LCLFLSQEPKESNLFFRLFSFYFLWPESAYITPPEPKFAKNTCFKSW
jgi:hypothetical protein